MPPIPRSRFDESDSSDDEGDIQELLDHYHSEPLSDKAEVAETTATRRRKIMEDWKAFFRNFRKNPDDEHIDIADKIWCWLCEKDARIRKRAHSYVLTFLTKYVGKATKYVLTLDSRESVKVRNFHSASSLEGLWRLLVAEADDTVLRQKREEDPMNAEKWHLQVDDKRTAYGKGRVCEITKWIYGLGAKKLNLNRTVRVEKIEATAEDVVIIANAVWQRADFVVGKPEIRISFLAMLLLASIGGFRPKALLNFTYEQLRLAVLRDPKDPSKPTTIAITVSVPIVKTRKDKGQEWIAFTVFFIPVPSICLASLITSLALRADAFDPSIDSVQTLLRRPNLENTNYLLLDWKESKKKDRIFPLDYRTYRQWWFRACLAAGLRKNPRLYTLRVGTGMDLDGVLADVLRNYVMSNTSAVFQKSYQTQHVRVNLLRQRYENLYSGPEIWNGSLERAMRSMTLTRDARAPLFVPQEYLDRFETRQDVIKLRKAFEEKKAACPDRMGHNKERMALQYLLRSLTSLTLKQLREDYFKSVDHKRALGESTLGDDTSDPELPKPVAAIANYIETCGSTTAYSQEKWLDMLLGLLTNRPVDQSSQDPSDYPNTLCLLCMASFPIRSRDRLTQHVLTQHIKFGTFDGPFPCPECRRLDRPDVQITGVSTWVGHVEAEHGLQHTPKLQSSSQSPESQGCEQCPFCSAPFPSSRLRLHMMSHVQSKNGKSHDVFLQSFQCLACQSKDFIHGQVEWDEHVSLYHSEKPWSWKELSMAEKIYKCLLCPTHPGFRRRSTLTQHCQLHHVEKGTFTSPFSCPRCPDYQVTGGPAWSNHTEQVHGIHFTPQLWSNMSPPTIEICPFCGEQVPVKGLYKHSRRHLQPGACGTVFSKRFTCQTCFQNKDATFEISGGEAWNRHVQSHHVSRIRSFEFKEEQSICTRKRKRKQDTGEVDQHRVLCLLCPQEYRTQGIRTHINKVHRKTVTTDALYHCIRCRQESNYSRQEWNAHVQTEHIEVANYFLIPHYHVSDVELPSTYTTVSQQLDMENPTPCRDRTVNSLNGEADSVDARIDPRLLRASQGGSPEGEPSLLHPTKRNEYQREAARRSAVEIRNVFLEEGSDNDTDLTELTDLTDLFADGSDSDNSSNV